MKQKAQWEILAAAVLWGIIGLFTKKLMDMGFTSMQIVAIRLGLSAILFSLILLIKDPKLLKIHPKDIVYFIGTGICSLVFFTWCYFSAIELCGLAVSAVLLYTAPIFVMLMSALLFHEKITLSKLLVVGTTFLGCVFVSGALGGKDRLTVPALLFGLGAGVGYALYSIIGAFALKKYSSETVTAYTFICGAVCVIPLSQIWKSGSILCTGPTVLSGLGIAVVCCIVPYLLYTKGLASTSPSVAAVLATVEPVTASVLGIAVYHEEVSLMKTVGILLVLGSVIWMNLFKENNKKRIP